MVEGLKVGRGYFRDLLIYVLLVGLLLYGIAWGDVSLPEYVFWVLVVRSMFGVHDPRMYLLDLLVAVGVGSTNPRLFYLSELVGFGKLPGVLFFALPMSVQLRQAERPLSLGIPVIWAVFLSLVAGKDFLEVALWFISLVLLSGSLAIVWISKDRRRVSWTEVGLFWGVMAIYLVSR